MKRLQHSFAIILFCFLAGFSACTKDELTKPATVNLQMEIADEEANMRTDGSKALVRIEKARYRFSSMEFQGYRQTGGDYFFTKDFEGGLEVVVEEGKPTSLLSFDMPQGVYDRINISLKIRKAAAGKDPDGKLLEKEPPYQENASIIMEGYYTSTQLEKIPLIFVYNYDEVLENPSSSSNNGSVTISKSANNQATIQFKIAYWMQLVNSRMFQSAKLTLVNGTPTIILSEDSNENIFNLLTSRIKNATELKFQ